MEENKLIDLQYYEIKSHKTSLMYLIHFCNNFNLKKLESIDIEVSDEFIGMKNSINSMIEKLNIYEKNIKLIQSKNDQLTKEIEFQNKELTDQLSINYNVERQKEEFLSMMTHEFKTPLTPIISWVDILLSKAFGDINDKQVGALNKIKNNSMKLLGLISDVLDANKLDLNEMIFNISMIHSTQIVDNLVHDFFDLMEKQKIKFIFSDIKDISLNSDPDRIEQVLRIFITNSIDFVPDIGGKIEIKVHLEKNSVVFSIIDNGIGVSKENQSKLFEKFYQIDSSVTRKHGGSGLGLSVAKGISEGLDSEIGIKSINGEGSAFFIKIPIRSKILEKIDS